MKQQILTNLEIMRLLLDESRAALAYLEEDNPEVHKQRVFFDEALLDLTWAIMNVNDSNY